MDQWLCKHPVDRLDRFQLIGIACLRTALGDMRRPTALVTEKHMDATTFAYLSDNTYNEEEVEAMTKVCGRGSREAILRGVRLIAKGGGVHLLIWGRPPTARAGGDGHGR